MHLIIVQLPRSPLSVNDFLGVYAQSSLIALFRPTGSEDFVLGSVKIIPDEHLVLGAYTIPCEFFCAF